MESLLCARHIASPLRIRFLPHPFPAQPFCAMLPPTGRPRLFPVTRPKIPRAGTLRRPLRPFPHSSLCPMLFFCPHTPLLAPHAVPCAQHSFLVLTHRSLRFMPFSCFSVPFFVPTARTLSTHYPIIIVVGYGALPHVHHWPLTFPRRPLCAASRVAPCAFPCPSASLVVPAREPSSLALRHSFGAPQAFLRHSCSLGFSLALLCCSLCPRRFLVLPRRSLCPPHELPLPHYPIIIVVGYGVLPHVHHWPLTFPRRPLCAASQCRAAPLPSPPGEFSPKGKCRLLPKRQPKTEGGSLRLLRAIWSCNPSPAPAWL